VIKKTRILICVAALAAMLVTAVPADAQITGLPRVSQTAAVTQTIGITTVTVNYHRPGVKGRTIYGSLVPYGQIWRAGANENTTVTFSHPVKVEGQDLAAGTYGLHTIPTETDWTVIFSNDYRSWGSFFYDETADALRVTAPALDNEFVEWLEFAFSDLTGNSALLELRWAGKRVPVRIEVDVHAQVLDKLRNDLTSLPAFFWWGWRDAANYCLQNDINNDEALQWIDRSIGIQENANNLVIKAGLLEQAGRTEEAVQIQTRALEIANEAEVNLIGYTFLQQGKTAQAIDVFRKNVADHPDSWNTYDSLGEAYRATGQMDLAVKQYKKALEMVEDQSQKDRILGLLDTMKP
jgi:tetratricopeptide (TPR) repeat protein